MSWSAALYWKYVIISMFVNKYKIYSYFIFINKVGWVPTSAVNQKAITDYWRNYTFLYSRLSKEKIHKIIYKQFRRKIFV